jgi:hypothetical protein
VAHDNNNPNVPSSGVASNGPVGTGMTISGGRGDIVTHNVFQGNGSWGLLLVPFPDTGTSSPTQPCVGGSRTITYSP